MARGRRWSAAARRAVWATALALLELLAPGLAAGEPRDTGWALFLDNDALTFGPHDHDYTGGLAVTLAGQRARDWAGSLDPALGALDRVSGFLGDAVPDSRWHALQVSVLAFTPGTIDEPKIVVGDRPYASIVYLANSRTSVMADAVTAYQTSLAVGLLGLDVAKAVQRSLHAATGAREPAGWDHQIADGGEPTARYSAARLRLRAAATRGRARIELKDSLAVSAGYLTEVNAALSLRAGAIRTPWWSFVPERAEYMTEPAPVLGGGADARVSEFYAWFGVKARARLYNALLQGQLRDSDLAYDFEDLRPLIGEAWAGVTGELGAGYRVSWVLRYQTAELRPEPGDRELLWGGVSVSRSF